MARINDQQAMRRFGFGPRGGVPEANVGEAIDDEIRRGSLPLDGEGLIRTEEAVEAYEAYREKASAAKRGKEAATKSPDDLGNMMSNSDSTKSMRPQGGLVSPLYRAEVAARQRRIRGARVGFIERLVDFWANHFAISTLQNGAIGMMAGAYEREAIRPYVLGRFDEMLLAVARHPAMLTYLDNSRSIGPNSPAGRKSKRGLNENLAREILELHTVGVAGGYSQDDVTSFARVLTGWTFERKRSAGSFTFRSESHEPGAHLVMGKTYPPGGVEQGEAVLRDLAAKPQTARLIARKFAVAFVADEPPAALVDKLERIFMESKGDLGQLTRGLIQSDEAWNAPVSKFTSPQEFVWSSVRCLNVELTPQFIVKALRGLGNQPWSPASPAGYASNSTTWLAPDSLTNRLDLAEYMTSLSVADDPLQLAEQVIGPQLSQSTHLSLKGAGSVAQALTLLLMSPEFLRR